MTYQHFMVDIETLGNTPDAPIFDIGIVHFDPAARTVHDAYQISISPDLQRTTTDASTIAWWLGQSDAARARAVHCIEKGADEEAGLLELSRFIRDRSPDPGNVRVYGNGATFDNVILDSAYRRAQLTPPWGYSGHRCHRTLVNLVSPRIKVERAGVHHNGLDDCHHQIKALFATMDALGLRDLS